MVMFLYMVRIRDVLAGSERWLIDGSGDPVRTHDRIPADLMALAVTDAAAGRLGYVVEIEDRFEYSG